MSRLHIDIETYSSEDLKKSGVHKYCESLDFEILMLAYAFAGEAPKVVDLAGGEQLPERVLEAMRDPAVRKSAHNAAFERVCLRAWGIDIPAGQWDCTMVKAASCGLPMSLAHLSDILALGGEAKQATGKALIKYFCQPCRPTKRNGGRMRNLPHHDADKWAHFLEYCRMDVVAEMGVHARLEKYDTLPSEKALYALDQKINDSGVLLDGVLASVAICVDNLNTERLHADIKEATGVDNPASGAQMRAWFSEALGREVKSLDKAAVEALLKSVEDGQVCEVLRLVRRASKTSTSKYTAMLACACDDWRMRGLFQFEGAGRTGRWAGRRVQLQNIPQNKLADLDDARALLRSGGATGFMERYPRVSDTLSQLIRTALVAPEGQTFAVADFSAIEARVIGWLASEKWRMDVFAGDGKIYEASAAQMFGVPVASITKDSPLRQKGKVAELALGYQGGVNALRTMGAERMGLTEEEMQGIVYAWRDASPAIVGLWGKLNAAAMMATRSKGRGFVLPKFRGLRFFHNGEALLVTLPSGRNLTYWEASLCVNRFGKQALRYKGIGTYSRKWEWTETYGGKLAENVVQAIARDLLADTMLRLDKAGHHIVMHVHDEVVCEMPKGGAEQSLAAICGVMGETPRWAEGLILTADGYTTDYYKKD